MKMLSMCIVALVASVPSFTHAAVPATPTLTAGAEFKGLRFDWDPVAGASWYQLEYRAHQTGDFVQAGDDYPATATSARFSFPLHLYDWTYARYRLAACNSSGCSRSPEVSVAGLRTYAPGYFKGTPNTYGARLGMDVDLSSDGNQFVTSAPADQSSGTVYAFSRRSNGSWYQRARLMPTIPEGFDENDNVMKVSTSGNGNVIVLGSPNYSHVDPDYDFDSNMGEVFIFEWNGTTWSRTALPHAYAPRIGSWVALNDAGNLLALEYGYNSSGNVAVYSRSSSGWQLQEKLVGAGAGERCYAGALSRDGSTIAINCEVPATSTTATRAYVRVYSGAGFSQSVAIPMTLNAPNTLGDYSVGNILAIDRTGSTIAAKIALPGGSFTSSNPSRVSVFKRSGAAWSQVAQFGPGSWRVADREYWYGNDISMSGDGKTIAVGDVLDNGWGTGPRAAPLSASGTPESGAVYVYRLSSKWQLANMVKANTKTGRRFGNATSLSNSGYTLIVGDPNDPSSAQGIGGNWANTGSTGSGAVWMY